MDFYELQQTHWLMGPVLFVLFIALGVFVILNLLIAVISDAYMATKEELRVKKDVHVSSVLHHPIIPSSHHPSHVRSKGICPLVPPTLLSTTTISPPPCRARLSCPAHCTLPGVSARRVCPACLPGASAWCVCLVCLPGVLCIPHRSSRSYRSMSYHRPGGL